MVVPRPPVAGSGEIAPWRVALSQAISLSAATAASSLPTTPSLDDWNNANQEGDDDEEDSEARSRMRVQQR